MNRKEIDILLKEYETCQSNNNSLESQVWTSTTIFMSFNVTLLGGLMYAVLANRIHADTDMKQIIWALSLLMFFGIIAILFLWKEWLKRTRLMRYINNSRMRQIEEKLEMWKNRMIPIVDNFSSTGDSPLNNLPPGVAKEIKEIKDIFGKTKPGAESLICIVDVTIALWFIVFIASSITIFT